MNYKKILLAFENPKGHVKVLKSALDLTDKYSGELKVLHINSNMAGVPSMARREFEKRFTQEELQDIVNEHNVTKVPVTIEVVTTNNVIDTVVDETKEADLLVMGHEHANMFIAAISDTTDEKIVNNIHCDSLIVNL